MTLSERIARSHTYRAASGNTYSVAGATVTIRYAALGTSAVLTFATEHEAHAYAACHASPVPQSPFVRRALAGTLPAKVLR